MNRRPRPNETLGEYINRVICGFAVDRRLGEFCLAYPGFIEPSYVFAPYIPLEARLLRRNLDGRLVGAVIR